MRAQSSGRPYDIVPLPPPNAHTAVSVAATILDRKLDKQERNKIALSASRWRAVVVSADLMRASDRRTPRRSFVRKIVKDRRLCAWAERIVFAALLGEIVDVAAQYEVRQLILWGVS